MNINFKTVDDDIQLAGGKNAGAAKRLLRTLLRQGEKGFCFPSAKEARNHADIAILLDLGFAQLQDAMFRRVKLGVRVLIDSDLASQLRTKMPKARRKKEPNKKKAFLWGKR